MDFRVSYEQKESIEAQGWSCFGELRPKSKAGLLTNCRQAGLACSAGAERVLLEGDEFVFVSIDKFAQGDSDGVTQASASKPLIGMANDPFRQGAFEEIDLVNALSLQPTNLVRRELGMNPRINLVRFVITARCQAIWIHRWAGYGRGGAGTNLPFLLSESFALVFQKYLSENAKSLLLAFSTVVSKATPVMKKSGLARNLGKLSFRDSIHQQERSRAVAVSMI